MRCNKHRLVFFNTQNCSILELIESKLVLLCFDLGALKVEFLVVTSRVDSLVDAVLILKRLNLEVISVVAKFANSSDFSLSLNIVLIVILSSSSTS